jgi:uncharacterized protein YjbI with pentapeptide repeats
MRGAGGSGADLFWANLSGAHLGGADLSDANLGRANLSTSRDLSPPQLARARGDAATQLPEGMERPAHWPLRLPF